LLGLRSGSVMIGVTDGGFVVGVIAMVGVRVRVSHGMPWSGSQLWLWLGVVALSSVVGANGDPEEVDANRGPEEVDTD